MAKKVYSFNAPPPATIYWDASFIVNFAHEDALHHQEAKNFLARLEAAETLSYVSTLALDETFFVLLQVQVQREHPSKTFWQVYNSNPKVIAAYMDALETLAACVLSHPLVHVVAVEPSSTLEALKYMRSFHLLPRDAFHLAAMHQYDVTDLATMDADFLTIPDITLYSCAPHILAAGKNSG